MKYSKEKLFWKNESDGKYFFFAEYDENKDYYSFVKEMIEKRCHQVVITSDIMLEYIKSIVSLGNVYIEKIEMMEEDDELIPIIDDLVGRCKTNRGILYELIRMLRYLDEESSVDIKQIYLSEDKEGRHILGYVQVNGVIGISTPDSEIKNTLLQCVKECLSE